MMSKQLNSTKERVPPQKVFNKSSKSSKICESLHFVPLPALTNLHEYAAVLCACAEDFFITLQLTGLSEEFAVVR